MRSLARRALGSGHSITSPTLRPSSACPTGARIAVRRRRWGYPATVEAQNPGQGVLRTYLPGAPRLGFDALRGKMNRDKNASKCQCEGTRPPVFPQPIESRQAV
jgi:hypothetical protein